MKQTAAAVLLALCALGAQAQTKKELAARVVAAQQQGVENVGRALAGQTAQRILQMAAPGVQRLAADKREAAGRDVQAEVKKFHDEIEPLLKKRAVELAPATLGAVYEERFSEDELKTIVAWLESPVSRKFGQLDREIGASLAEKVIADTRTGVEARMKTLEAAVNKRLGLQPPAAASAPKKP